MGVGASVQKNAMSTDDGKMPIASDDLANNWGCNLINIQKRGKKRAAGTVEEGGWTVFQSLVAKEFGGKFILHKVTPNGSDANLFAVNYLTKGNNDCCAIACGSYVAGDQGPLHSWTTSTFSVECGPSGILSPDNVATEFTKQHTIALPYHISGCVDDDDLSKYEDECLNNLHIRCLVQKMKKTPIRALLMEIALANNGSTLSDRALSMLGELASLHGFKIIVDEIMTGGRTGSMLLSTSKPSVFVDAIAHITMGKWLQVGLVLTSKAEHEQQLKAIVDMPGRGASTNVDCKEPVIHWQFACDEIQNTMLRRETVLKKIKVTEHDAWGQGVLIFAPVARMGSYLGTKNRFLPKLSLSTVHVGHVERTSVNWTKFSVNSNIMTGSKAWLYPYYLKTEEEKTYYMLITKLAPVYPPGAWLQAKYILVHLFGGKPYNMKSIAKVLRTAQEAGLLKEVKKTKERLRAWELQETMSPPWGLSPDKKE